MNKEEILKEITELKEKLSNLEKVYNSLDSSSKQQSTEEDEVLTTANRETACNSYRNTGNYNTGYGNSGDYNSGNYNSGNYNSGYYNSGDSNSGYRNSGDYNTGDRNSGDYNSGNFNDGYRNSGHHNSGSYNSGHHNSGNHNSGNYNSGDYNSGDWNKSSYNNGCFNTIEPPIMIFNKPSEITYLDWLNSSAKYLLNRIPKGIVEWIVSSDMNDEEKAAHPEHKTTGGYLKVLNEIECRQIWWDGLTESQKEIFKSIPNFDASIFEEITGIKID